MMNGKKITYGGPNVRNLLNEASPQVKSAMGSIFSNTDMNQSQPSPAQYKAMMKLADELRQNNEYGQAEKYAAGVKKIMSPSGATTGGPRPATVVPRDMQAPPVNKTKPMPPRDMQAPPVNKTNPMPPAGQPSGPMTKPSAMGGSPMGSASPVPRMKSGGSVSKRADGIAQRGKTKGRMC
jgi:hypothetical protein